MGILGLGAGTLARLVCHLYPELHVAGDWVGLRVNAAGALCYLSCIG
jgi:hypothetical protein